jgi:hypothetical protein
MWNKTFFKALGFSEPLISGIAVRVQKEGTRTFLGTSEIDFQKLSVTHQWKPEKGAGIAFNEFIALAHRLGQNMARQQAEHMCKILSQPGPCNAVLESTDGVFSFDDFLVKLEGMEIGFDSVGRPQLPSFYLEPISAAKMEAQQAEWTRNEVCRKRFADLLAKKRKEFDEREACRKLVD